MPLLLTLLSWQTASGQTLLEGTILSASGEPIPEIYVTVRAPGPTDIFTDRNKSLKADQDGFFRTNLTQKGIYSIRINSIYHRTVSIPLLAEGQQSVRFTLYLIPERYNDGEYFVNDSYLEWIRVSGNFNDYDYKTGRQFRRIGDGSIHAFIPAQTDTIRYQIRGLSHRGGPHPHPKADAYNLRDDGSFESVLYSGLPADSVEIRYTPRRTIPYQDFFSGLNYSGSGSLSGFIAFKYPADRHWIMPLLKMRRFPRQLVIIDHPGDTNLPVFDNINQLMGGQTLSSPFNFDYVKLLAETEQFLQDESLHRSQRGLLYLQYASLLQTHQMNNEYRARFSNQPAIAFPEYNEQFLTQIPEYIHPAHPAWSLNRDLPGFLLHMMSDFQSFKIYLSEIIALHPIDGVAEQAAIDLFRATASEYGSADEVPAFQLALKRFGNGRLFAQLKHLFDTEIDREGGR